MSIEKISKQIKTPAYIVDEGLVKKNLEILKKIKDETGCEILLAQKAFSMFTLYPLIKNYLDGTTASGLFEAKLGYEEMGMENHIFSPAYLEDEFEEITDVCDHIVFNSFSQWLKYKEQALVKGCECGIRINPELSTQKGAIYDPCSYGSRLGVTIEHFQDHLLSGISGLHFHTLCEQNVDDLILTLDAVEKKFGQYLINMKWLNFGGGHHITRDDYDRKRLIEIIKRIQNKYNLKVYLEPGEAVVLDSGFLVTKVLEIVENNINIAIIDASIACHMPDVLEMPYRPEIINSGKPSEKAFTYRLGGPTCLAGDSVGDYSFDEALKIGDRLIFCDMAHYTMVKNNTFNGMRLPLIAVLRKNKRLQIIKEFGYEDFKMRLS